MELVRYLARPGTRGVWYQTTWCKDVTGVGRGAIEWRKRERCVLETSRLDLYRLEPNNIDDDQAFPRSCEICMSETSGDRIDRSDAVR